MKWDFSSKYFEDRRLTSLRWAFEKANLAQPPDMDFQVFLAQVLQDDKDCEDELVNLLDHYSYVRLLGAFPGEIEESKRQRVLEEYQLLFQLFAENGVNVEALEEDSWKENGVVVPIQFVIRRGHEVSWETGPQSNYLLDTAIITNTSHACFVVSLSTACGYSE